jgi:DNA-binding SARP family transcriptional activator
MAQVQSDPARGLATLRLACDAFAQTTAREGRALCLAAMIHARLLQMDDVAVADEWLGELIDEIQTPLPLSPEAELSVWSAITSGTFYLRPWHPLAQTARQRVQQLLDLESDPTVALMAATTTLCSDSESGNVEMGDALAARVAPLADRPEASPSARAWFLYSVAGLRFFQARYEESLEYFDAACKAASGSGLHATLAYIRLTRVIVEYRLCGWATASATLREFELQAQPMRPYLLTLLRNYQARRAYYQGRSDEAGTLAASSQEAIRRVGSPQLSMEYGLFNADILIGAGRLAEARDILATARDILSRSPVLDRCRAGLVLCEAFLAQAEGDAKAALDRLRQALALAKEGERRYWLRYFECSRPPMFCLALEQGIEVDLVQQLIRMFRLKPPVNAPDLWPRPVRIWTLGQFTVHVDDQPIAHSRKVPRKTLALLKALIAHGGEAVPEQWLCDSLWGDEEADAARNVLGVTVARLRKLLGSDEVVSQQGGKVGLDRQRCWVDAWRFQALLADASDANHLHQALKLYAGAFLVEEEGEAWPVAMRERLRGKFIHALATCSQALEAQGHIDEAIHLYLRGIEADVVVEAFHCGLMRCYKSSGRLTEAVSAYRRLRQTASAVLGVSPSAAAEALYREVLLELAAAPSETTAPPPRKLDQMRLARSAQRS